jgi:hypothetical protein
MRAHHQLTLPDAAAWLDGVGAVAEQHGSRLSVGSSCNENGDVPLDVGEAGSVSGEVFVDDLVVQGDGAAGARQGRGDEVGKSLRELIGVLLDLSGVGQVVGNVRIKLFWQDWSVVGVGRGEDEVRARDSELDDFATDYLVQCCAEG